MDSKKRNWLDHRATSFLVLGLLLGVLGSAGAFAVLVREDATAGAADGGPAAPRQVVLKLAHVLDQTHPVHEAMLFMAKRLAEKSGGRMELQVFPSGQLGTETESIEQVQRGALAMVKSSAAPLEGFIPELAIFSLPYIFRDSEHYWKVLNGPVGRELANAGEGVGLKGLCYYDSGSRSFYTIGSPILSPADLDGRKIRVMRSKTAMNMISAMGGAPTPIDWGELYTALQQGMVDGAENNPPSLHTSRHFEVTKHYSLDEHTRIPDMVLFSKRVWDSLSPEMQGWLQEAAAESVTFQRKLWEAKTEKALADLKAAGVTIHHPDKAAFRTEVESMYKQHEGTKLGALIKRIQAVQ